VHLQVGPIMQYVTTLVQAHDGEVKPEHGLQQANH